MQPLAFSKELLPVGARIEDHVARPRAVAEYLVERLILGGAERLIFVVGPDKSDIMPGYFGGPGCQACPSATSSSRGRRASATRSSARAPS